MKCTVKNIPSDTTPEELDRMILNTKEGIDHLLASKNFITHCPDGIKTKGLEIGMPIRVGDEPHDAPILPDRDDSASEIGCTSA